MEHEKVTKNLEFCDRSWNLTNFAPEVDKICAFLLTLGNIASV